MSSSFSWNVFLSITKEPGTLRLDQTSNLPEGVTRNDKKLTCFHSLSKENKANCTFYSRRRTCGGLYKTSRCVNLNMGLPRSLQHPPPPNKVYRTTRQRIPAPDTSGPEASAAKPRHLCQRATITLGRHSQDLSYQNRQVFGFMRTKKSFSIISMSPVQHRAHTLQRKMETERPTCEYYISLSLCYGSTSQETRAAAKCGLLSSVSLWTSGAIRHHVIHPVCSPLRHRCTGTRPRRKAYQHSLQGGSS